MVKTFERNLMDMSKEELLALMEKDRRKIAKLERKIRTKDREVERMLELSMRKSKLLFKYEAISVHLALENLALKRNQQGGGGA